MERMVIVGMDIDLKQETRRRIDVFFERHNDLCGIKESILLSVRMLADAFAGGNKLLLCGNGGSCADCDHIAHVNTQLPYVLLVAGVSFVGYVLAGFIQNAWIVLPVSLVLMAGALLAIRSAQNKKAA